MSKPVIFLLIFVPGLCAAGSVYSQDTTVTLTRDMFDEDQVIFLSSLEGWVFRPGNDPAWADPDLDTSDWEALRPSELTVRQIPTGRPVQVLFCNEYATRY